jgi:hypothetical protein
VGRDDVLQEASNIYPTGNVAKVVELGENGTGKTNERFATKLASAPSTTARIYKYRFVLASLFLVWIPAQFSSVNMTDISRKLEWGSIQIYASITTPVFGLLKESIAKSDLGATIFSSMFITVLRVAHVVFGQLSLSEFTQFTFPASGRELLCALHQVITKLEYSQSSATLSLSFSASGRKLYCTLHQKFMKLVHSQYFSTLSLAFLDSGRKLVCTSHQIITKLALRSLHYLPIMDGIFSIVSVISSMLVVLAAYMI